MNDERNRRQPIQVHTWSVGEDGKNLYLGVTLNEGGKFVVVEVVSPVADVLRAIAMEIEEREDDD